ncbi:hypothetical protein ABIA39_006195 [Nocardia sp. GAS34]|uniref:DUF3159 domain-containing protein n=1 Tax=unclassified Nocardia TaxID=2637762 RepID=UPI003D241E55
MQLEKPIADQNASLADMWAKFRTMHGPRHLLDGAAPAIGFLIGYSTVGPKLGILVAIAIALGLGVFRVFRGDSARVVATSVAVIFLFSLFVLFTGEGRGFYLPEILFCVVATVGFGITLVGRRPLSLWLSQRVGLEPRDVTPDRVRVHRRITLAWFAFWVLHVVVMGPLYLADKVLVLGTVALFFGKPALVAMIAVTWLWIVRSRRSRA